MHNSVRPQSKTKLKQLSEKLARNELQMSEIVEKIVHNYGKLESFMGCSIDQKGVQGCGKEVRTEIAESCEIRSGPPYLEDCHICGVESD